MVPEKIGTGHFSYLCKYTKIAGAHILDLETIGFVTSGLRQLSISDNWPQAQLASQTIGSMKPWKNENNYV